METVKLSIDEAQEVYQGIQLLAQRYNDKLSVAASLLLARISRKLKPEVEIFEQQRDRLILKHGSQQEDGSFGIRVGTEAMLNFSRELHELRRQQAGLDVEPLRVCRAEAGEATIEGINLDQIDAGIILLLSPILAEA